MAYKTLVSVKELADNLENPDWMIVDCRFTLAEPEWGHKTYQQEHIAGAVYANLDDDLSGPIIPGKTSRHPLPETNEFAEKLSAWGIDEKVQVVVYDDRAGGIAGRLWWMLKWLGHEAAAVLDGGYPEWTQGNKATRDGIETRTRRSFIPKVNNDLLVNVDDVIAVGKSKDKLLIDSRAPIRFSGESEQLDPVAGHIPGAINLHYVQNIDEDGLFFTPEKMQERFVNILGDTPAEGVVFYCGSGVTAAHNILSVAHAGLGMPKMYAGSWSEWITDPDRPVAAGDG